VQATIHYPVAIHQQGYYQNIVGDVSLPVTERAAGRILSLPTYPELDATELEQVAGLIHQFAASL
jgi:dTDP-4-amino-4,6-dideoxygalactose transaminase